MNYPNTDDFHGKYRRCHGGAKQGSKYSTHTADDDNLDISFF